ncbi:hypothetical protein BLOT_005285 [Blomia tropicalis]|nr:hypothetical protein BLOT_005285 [Blomia tropicalis]
MRCPNQSILLNSSPQLFAYSWFIMDFIRWKTIILLLITIPLVYGQTFTESEKNFILQRHRQRLEQESLKMFEGQMFQYDTRRDYRNRFQRAINYEGRYESIRIVNVTTNKFICSNYMNRLIGFDYKRHSSAHRLLCFNTNSFLVQTFQLINSTQLQFDNHPMIDELKPNLIDGDIKQAKLYRKFDTDKLFVAILKRRGTFMLETYEIEANGSVTKTSFSHEFRFGEEVIKFDILHYDINKIKFVALLMGINGQQNGGLQLVHDEDVLKLSIQKGNNLKTLRILSQGYILASNTTHWCAYRYLGDSRSEMILLYQSRSMIVDLQTMTNGNRYFVAVAAQYDQYVYRWDGRTFRGTARMSQRNNINQYRDKPAYKINTLMSSYTREDIFFYFNFLHQNSITLYGYDVNQRSFVKLTNFHRSCRQILPMNQNMDRNFALELKMNVEGTILYLFAFETQVDEDGTRNARLIEMEKRDDDRVKIESNLANLRYNTKKLEKQETVSKTHLNLTFNFQVKFNAKVYVKRLESPDPSPPQQWFINQKRMKQESVYRSLYHLHRNIQNVIQIEKAIEHDLDHEVVYRSHDANITGMKEFVNFVNAPRIDVRQSFIEFYRGLNMKNLLSTLYRISTNQPIGGIKTMLLNLGINGNVQTNFINTIRPDHLLYVLRKDERNKQVFRVSTQMNVMNARSDIHCAELNGYKSETLFGDLIRKNGKSNFDHPVRIIGDLHVRYLSSEGRLNGIRIPDDLMDRHTEQIVHGIKKFSYVSIDNVELDRLNGISIPDDIITLSRDEMISGHLTLDQLQLNGNLQVEGLIDNVNLTHLDQRYISSLKSNYPVHAKLIKIYSGLSNGINLDNIYHDSIFNHSSNVYIPSTKTISSILKCDSIRAEIINGQQLNQFIKTYHVGNFTQRVTFKNSVQFGSIDVRDTIDTIPVKAILDNIASLDGQRMIYGRKNFKELVRVDRLIVEGGINHIRPTSWMLYSAEQNITNSKSFTNAHVTHLQANQLNIVDNLNGKNVTQMLQNMIWLNGKRSLDAQIHCSNCTASQMRTTYVNGKNFTYFVQNHLSKSGEQTIRSKLNFKTAQRFGMIETRNGIYGIDLRRIHRDVITLHGHNVIRNPVLIEGNLRLLNGRLTSDNFNKINITEYDRMAVKVNQSSYESSQKVHGKITYANGFDVHANLRVNRLNDHLPEELIMTNNRNYNIKGRTHFGGKVTTSGNVRVRTLINGIDLRELNRTVLKVNDRGEVDGSINIVSKIHVNQLNVDGLVDRIPINRKSILMSNRQQNIERLVLNGPTRFATDLNVWNTINGYHQDNLNKIVRINSNQEQVFNASQTFSSISAGEIRQLRGDVHIRMINGVDVRHFESVAVHSGSNRTINIHQNFLQNVTIYNHSVRQTITGVKTFERVQLNDDIDVIGRVNDLDLPSIQNNILYDVGQQSIPGSVRFRAPIYLNHDSQVDSLNNIKPEHLLTLDGADQHVNGQLQFKEVKVEQVDSRLVNKINFTEISEHVWYKNSNRPQTIPGTITVNAAVFDDNVNLRYHLNNVDLNVAVETAKVNLNQKIDIKGVATSIQSYTNSLYQQRSRYEHATFEINHLSPVTNDIGNLPLEVKNIHSIGSSIFIFRELLSMNLSSHIHQSFMFNGRSNVVLLVNNRIKILQLDGRRLITIYDSILPPSTKPLVFVMDQSIHVLYGVEQNRNCSISTQTYLERLHIDPYQLSVTRQVVQYFDEADIINLGHFQDLNGYDHLIFNSHQLNGNGRQIQIFKRFDYCRFELIQSIAAPTMEMIALFKFGKTNGLMEQYLCGLDRHRLTLWKQQGIRGFSQSWNIRTTIDHDMIPFQLLPYIEHSKLIIYAPTCPINLFEANLNTNLTQLKLLYDDFI